MEYCITRTYYYAILTKLRKKDKKANYKSVIKYLNEIGGFLREIKKLKLSV